jgi:hypothetical protein
MDISIPEANSFKCLGIILHSDLGWADQIIDKVKKAWRALHFTKRIFKSGKSNTKRLAYMSHAGAILE